LCCNIFFAPFVYFINYLHRCINRSAPKYNLRSLYINTFMIAVLQDHHINPTIWLYRYIFYMWSIFCLLISVLYSGNLIASFTIPSLEKPIDSLYDLVRASDEKDMCLALIPGTVYEFWFEAYSCKETRNYFRISCHMCVIHHFLDKLVLTENVAYPMSKIGAQCVFAQGRKPYLYHIGRETFNSDFYGIAVSSGSPFRKPFEKILLRLNEAGLIDKWANDEIYKMQSSDRPDSSGLTQITMDHLQAAFYLILSGHTISLLVFITELIFNKYYR
ncbi:unnamed protein product, partial [Meganyctiphanes norvegica]